MARLGTVLVVVAGLTGLAVSSASVAGANPVRAEQIDRAKRIYEPQAFVSPIGEQLISYKAFSGIGSPALGVRARRGGGRFGPLDVLSRTPNADPPAIVFNPSGRAYAIWGIATNGEFAEKSQRAPGGLFEVTRSGAPCKGSAKAAVGPDKTLAVVCPQSRDTDPPDFWGISFDDGLGVSGVGLSPYTYDSNIEPQVAWGRDGTFVAATKRNTTTTSPPPAVESSEIQYWIRGQGTGAFIDSGSTAPVLNPDYVQLNETTVTHDGRVVLSTGTSTGAKLMIRSAGPGGVFSTTNLLGDAVMQSAVDRQNVLHVATAEYGPPYLYRVYRQRPGSGLGPPVAIPTPDSSTYLPYSTGFHVAPDGTEFAVMRGNRGVFVSVRPRGIGTFRPPVKIGPRPDSNPSAAIVPGDNLMVTWSREAVPGDQRVMVGGWDSGRPPTVSGVHVPRQALVRIGTGFSARAFDPMGVRSIRWSFGDRRSATGASVSHSYRRPGRYRVRVTATDKAGNRRTISRVIRVFRPSRP